MNESEDYELREVRSGVATVRNVLCDILVACV
jgi:hypothetical protein